MRQIDVVVVPDKNEVVRGQVHRRLVLGAHRTQALGQVDDAHLGVVEGERLPVVIVEDDQLFLATSDPLNNRALEEIRSYLGFRDLRVFLAGENDVRQTIRKYYGV